MNILVAVDLSPASEKVVEAAGRVAKLTGARVYVLHTAEPEPDFVGYDAGPEVVRTQVANEYRREHRKEHDRQKERQRLGHTITFQVEPADAENRPNHSRRSLPVSEMKTSWSVALPSETSCT